MNTPLTFRPYRPSSNDTVYRDNLPHRSCPGKTIFVTWRLSDSLPAKAEFETMLHKTQLRWLQKHCIPFDPYSQDVEALLLNRCPEKLSEFRLLSFRTRESFDSRKLGSCVLRKSVAIEAVRNAMLEEEKWSVRIGDFVISCNHVHMLMVMGKDSDLKRSMQRIKGRASCYLGRMGIEGLPKPIWQRYWFDHVVREWGKLTRIRKYIANHIVAHESAKHEIEWVAVGHG